MCGICLKRFNLPCATRCLTYRGVQLASSDRQTRTKPLRCTTSLLPALPCFANAAACRRFPARTDADNPGSLDIAPKCFVLVVVAEVDLHDQEVLANSRRHRCMVCDVVVELVAPAAPLAAHLQQDPLLRILCDADRLYEFLGRIDLRIVFCDGVERTQLQQPASLRTGWPVDSS